MDMKILIVDDDENSRICLERALINQGYRVESVANGAEALEMVDNAPPHLIISDILMPGLDGFELCRRVKTDDRLRSIPFVFYSATYVAPEDRGLAMKLGASRFLIKPMQLDDFMHMVDDVIREHQLKTLPVPDRPLADRNELSRLQMEALSRKLDDKVREVAREREARRKSESDYLELKDMLKEMVREGVAQERKNDDRLVIQARQSFMAEMINNIAHQWRQPINTLGLLAQDLQMTYRLGDFSKEFIDTNVSKTIEVIQKLSRTIDDFSTFFRADRAKVDFRVLGIVSKVTIFLEERFRARRIGIELRANGDPVVRGYPGEFSQAILNILMNARDALVARKVEKPAITITVLPKEAGAVIIIADNGGGIPEEIIGKIFDPYFTTKGPDRGTGLGLFMAKSIVEKNMGGSLTASNARDGAEFRIEL